MTRKYILSFIYILIVAAFASCRQDDGSPIRNVRFDPNLLNQARDGSTCQTYTYMLDGKQVNLGVVYTRQILVSFAPEVSYDAQKEAISEYGFIKKLGNQVNTNSGVLYNLTLADGLNCAQTEMVLSILAKDNRITYSAPYFADSKNLLGLNNEVLVTLKQGSDINLEGLLQNYGSTLVQKLYGNVYSVKLDKNSKGNALQFVNYIQKQEGVESAEPDFVISQEMDYQPTLSGRRGILEETKRKR